MKHTILTARALREATVAHAGQVRKYTGEPYITHPIAVAEIVSMVTKDQDVIAAALLHDVIEDCGIGSDEIRALFGDRVADLVLEVTDVSTPEDGNRAARKQKDREHLAKASPEGMTIKLADLIHNTSSIVERDPGFARIYMQEKRELLDVLRFGNKTLLLAAGNQVKRYFNNERINEVKP